MSIFQTKILLATDGSIEAQLAARTAVEPTQNNRLETARDPRRGRRLEYSPALPRSHDPKRVENSKINPADATMIKPGANTSFGALKQIDAGLLNVGYAEAGPTILRSSSGSSIPRSGTSMMPRSIAPQRPSTTRTTSAS
jgi:hypothetical protein